MSDFPIHLEPQTYWEKRSQLTEEAVMRLAEIVSNFGVSHAGHYALREWRSEWGRIHTELIAEHKEQP